MKILCAYNANIDSITHVEAGSLSRMIEEHSDRDLTDKLENPPGAISSISDFFTGLVICIRDGTGAEWLIQDMNVFEWLKETFLEGSLMRMGGNMGIMANVLSELGASKVIPNVASLTKLQSSFFSDKAIFHPFNGKLYRNSEIENRLPDDEKTELIHFVFDFKKGDTIVISGERISAPRENRFIATYDPLNFQLYIDEDFRNYSQAHAVKMDGAIISGYHMLQEKDPQGSEDYKEKIDQSFRLLQNWKRIRPELHIHVEFGHFSSGNIASYTFSTLSPIADRIGMNEDELAMLAGLNEIDPKPITSMEPVAITEAAIDLCRAYGLRKMLVHTREFVVSVSSKKEDDPEIIIEAMNFGASCAAAFACTEKLADRETMLAIASGIKESKPGKQASSELADQMQKKLECSTVCGIHNSYQITIVPTRICDDPVSTVGLGDTISAAIFLRELELKS